jgi:exopolyphosphatase/guanosine-5'-triphosphate,3'-diphosphate pyrophosphatase
MIYAAIDIGTNSVRLLVATYRKGCFHPLKSALRTTQLGQKLASSGVLSPPGRQATLEAVTQFIEIARIMGAKKIVTFATSAMREAVDGYPFAMLLEAQTGQKTEIISAETEAAWSFVGVEKSLPNLTDMLVFDLGGGSCELIWRQDRELISCSRKIGAVYLTDTYLHHDPPQKSEIEAACRFIREQLATCVAPPKPLVGVGGTVTSLAAMVMGLRVYDTERIHGSMLTHRSVQSNRALLLSKTAKERESIPGLQKERASIIPAGAMVVDNLLASLGMTHLTVSEGDILLGSLYALAD